MLGVDASVWLPSAALVLGAIITAWGQWATRSKLGALHNEVKTGNDKTSGQLASITRGRQIDEDIPPEDQTEDEAHYVDQYLHGRPREEIVKHRDDLNP